jgi:hypothetical protein
MRKGVWITLAGFPLAFVAALLTAIDDVFAVFFLLPVLCFIAGFIRLLYGAFLEKSAFAEKKDIFSQEFEVTALSSTAGLISKSPELPSPAFARAESFSTKEIKTAEMVPPLSVTDNTTKLFDQESDSSTYKPT